MSLPDMSVPGDRRIDTDPTDDPDPLDIIEDILGALFDEREAIADAYEVLADDEASLAAESLALRTLKDSTRGYSQLLDQVRKQATRLQEEVDTLERMDAA